MERRRNQDNLNISVGIQSLLTCNDHQHVVYEMYNIKEMGSACVFACSVNLYKLHFC
jgi:hypothetical protein